MKKATLVVLFLVLVLALVSCNGDDAETPSTTVATQGEAVSTAAETTSAIVTTSSAPLEEGTPHTHVFEKKNTDEN